jgi:ferredoxin
MWHLFFRLPARSIRHEQSTVTGRCNITENCVDHCHGCGNKCPVGAITYVGEDTGWTPPALKKVRLLTRPERRLLLRTLLRRIV